MNDHDGGLLALSAAGRKGLGVFARRAIDRGERVLSFEGSLLPIDSVVDFTHVIQVDSGLFLSASGGIDDYVNHSCEPNCGLLSAPRKLVLEAVRDIEAGEEITFDYSTCMLEEPAMETCECEAPTCRGRIGRFWELDGSVRKRYRELGVVPSFVSERRPQYRLSAPK